MAIQNSDNITDTGIISADGAGVFTGRSIVGEQNFIDVANGNGTAGNPTVSVASNFEDTGMHGWNGSLLETASVTVSSDGATITCSVELSGGGDLTAVFSDGYYSWDTSPADTVTLTAGTDSAPQINYIYLLQSNKTLTNSTTSFPSGEHAPIATVVCQSAASLQTDGAYKVHVWTDHVKQTSEQGHVADLNYWIRNQNATWLSGVAQTYTITPNGGAADNVILTTGVGEILQLHDHTFPAFAGTPDVYVVNDSVTPYTKVTDLNALLTDSTGASMSGKYFSLVIWGVVSEATADCKLFCNLPSGSYNNSTDVTNDPNRYATFTIPSDYRGTGFLISQWNLRHQTASGGTWTSIDEVDLRGFFPNLSAGGSNAFPNEFVDTLFRVYDDGDTSKKVALQCSGITGSTTRTMTIPDADGTIAYASGLAANGMAYAIDGNTVDSTAAASNGEILIGSTGTIPALGTITGGTGLTTTNGAGSIQLDLDVPVSINNGGTARQSHTPYAVICGGTGATTAQQSIASVGTSGQVLTSNGAGALPTFQNSASGSGWVFLSSATASASATLEFSSSIDSTYQMYAFLFSDIQPATNGARLEMRTSTDGGSTFDSGASDYNYYYYGQATSAGGSSDSIQVTYLIGNTGNESASGLVYMYNPSSVEYTKFNYQAFSVSSAAAADNPINGGGGRWSVADVDAIQFLMSSGNITSGTIRMYGCCTPS